MAPIECAAVHPALEQLLRSLDLQEIGPGVYRGSSPQDMGNHLFGGQVVAQALVASNRLASGQPAHSLHAFFLYRGTPRLPIDYEVEERRRSTSFLTFEVRARQEGKVILQALISHHSPELGPEHHALIEDMGAPEGELYEEAMMAVIGELLPEDTPRPDRPSIELPVEVRGVGGLALFSREIMPPKARCWMRARGPLPEDPALHQALFAYASDYAIMAPAIHPHPFAATDLQTASLDHALWFHRPFRFDEWTLFQLDSPISAGARGLGRGLLYDREGALVASCVQEGLLRTSPAKR